MKAMATNFMHYAAVFTFMLALLLGMAWIAGCNLDGSWADPFNYDHPENFTRAQ
jgi:hypothetical protein